MKILRCSSSTGNASWAVGYLLRKEETGIVETTEIMQDAAFREAIQLLLDEHQQQFEATEAIHYQNMAATDFQPSESKKVQQNRDRIRRHHDLLGVCRTFQLYKKWLPNLRFKTVKITLNS